MQPNSDSLGDPARFRRLDELESGLQALASASRDHGRVALIVSRRDGGRRETPDRVRLTAAGGIPGDAWSRRANRASDGQITVMELDVARLIANGQPLTLFGDNLFLELDLSAGNLPPGSRLRVGDALVEVTAKPHDGCQKFRARFGDDALRFVSQPVLRHRNFRGIYVRVVEDGELRPGDSAVVVARALRARPETHVSDRSRPRA